MLVGGTALAGWQIRAHSRDVDLYMPEISPDAVEIVEQELQSRYGPSFRLDVTTGENVWGTILVRDITASPVVGAIADLELRALRIEDLFLLKLASARARDLDDLALIAPRTTIDALVDRWNQLVKWHGDRHAVLGFADALVVQLQRLFAGEPLEIIARLDVTAGQRELLARHPPWQRINMISREDVERAILDEESMLEQVSHLLESWSAMADWPGDAQAALALALADDTMSRAESWKAVALRRHLFGPTSEPQGMLAAPRQPSTVDRRRAERLRSELTAIVRYRAGMYLLSTTSSP